MAAFVMLFPLARLTSSGIPKRGMADFEIPILGRGFEIGRRMDSKSQGRKHSIMFGSSFCQLSLVGGRSVDSRCSFDLFPNPLSGFVLAAESSDVDLFCNDPQGCARSPEHVTKEKMAPSSHRKSNGNGTSTYEPISSIWEGTDGDLLEAMFKFYAVIPPEPILDATYNAGRFWKGSKRRVVSMDIDPRPTRDPLRSQAAVYESRNHFARTPSD
jgi:hypothetical protein